MAQVSRPFQIALAAAVLFAVVWFVALQGHSSSSTPVASTPASTPAPAATAKAPAGTTHIEGMTRAVTHAREAVAASQRTSDKSAGASAEAPIQGANATASSTTVLTKHGADGSSATVATKHGAAGASTAVVTKHSAAGTSTTVVTKQGAAGASTTVVAKHVATPAPHKVAAGGIPAQQAAVESELKRGEVAVVLFWNKKGADDVAVHEELQILLAAHHEVAVHPNKAQVRKLRLATGLELEKKIAVHYATAAQVTEFGSFTKTVQVYGTPTILIINPHGSVTTMNGLTDAFAIEQTIDEARQESK